MGGRSRRREAIWAWLLLLGSASPLLLGGGCAGPGAGFRTVDVRAARSGVVPVWAFRHVVIAGLDRFPANVVVEALTRELRIRRSVVVADRPVAELVQAARAGALPARTGILVLRVDVRPAQVPRTWEVRSQRCSWTGCAVAQEEAYAERPSAQLTLRAWLVDPPTRRVESRWRDQALRISDSQVVVSRGQRAVPDPEQVGLADEMFRAALTLARRVAPELERQVWSVPVAVPALELPGVDLTALEDAVDGNDWGRVRVLLRALLGQTRGVTRARALHLWAVALEFDDAARPRGAALDQARDALREAVGLEPEQTLHRRALRRLERHEALLRRNARFEALNRRVAARRAASVETGDPPSSVRDALAAGPVPPERP